MATEHCNGSSKAVLYLRMSSDHQETSIDDQRSELERYAHKHGYSIADEYLDEAISGDDTLKRAGFLRMRDDCSSGSFDVVLCWDQDRFGRFDLLDAGHWIMPFREAGVRLETIAQGRVDWEGLVGQLIYSVNQMGKAQFLRDLSRNTIRGLLAYAREARSGTGGRTPFGYKSENGEVSIITTEAEIVRWIFSAYLKPGGSLLAIASELNRRKVPTPNTARGISRKTAGVWRGSSVRSILERRKYLGEFVYGVRNGGRYFAMRDEEIVPRRKSDKHTKAEPITHAAQFEPIIDQEIFDRVQVKLAGNRTKTSRRSARQYLLSGLIRCGDCGGAMGGLRPKNPIYRCRLYHESGKAACYCNTVSEAPLVSCIVRKIQEKYLSPAALDRLRKALAQEQERTRPRPRDLSRLRKEIDVLDRKIDQGAERILEVSSEIVPILVRKVEEFKSERDRLNQELESLTRHETRSNGKDDSEIDRAIKALKTLGKALDKAKPEDTRDLLSSIVSKIEVHYSHQETAGGRKTSEFSHGLIHLRPDVGGGRAAQPDSGNSTHLNNKGRYFDPRVRSVISPIFPYIFRRSLVASENGRGEQSGTDIEVAAE